MSNVVQNCLDACILAFFEIRNRLAFKLLECLSVEGVFIPRRVRLSLAKSFKENLMKQFAILFAAVCAMTFMAGQADAQCGGGGGYYGGGGYGGGYRSYSAPVYRQSTYRPVYGGSYGSGFGGYGTPYRGGGISIGIGRSYGGGFGGFGGSRGFGHGY